MKSFYYPALCLATCLVLTACNDNGTDRDASTNKAPLISLTGVVIADNALEGATVCLDKNNNVLCDVTEPQAITDAQGQYTLNKITTGDSASYKVIAIVPVGAIDHNALNETVSKTYTLTTPIGKHGVISPTTTIVDELIQENIGIDNESAQQIASYRLQVAHVDLMQDYSKQTDEVFQHLQTTNKNITYRLAAKQQWFTNNASLSTYPNLMKYRVAVSDIWQHLDYDLPFDAMFATLYSNSNFDINVDNIADFHFFSRNYQQQSIDTLLAEPSLFTLGGCFESSECLSYHYNANNVDYNQVSVQKTADKIAITDNLQSYDFNTKTSQAIEKTQNYTLGTDGWIEGSQALLDAKQQKTLLYKMDVAGLPISAVLSQQTNLINSRNYRTAAPEKTFPNNAYLYKLVRINTADEYYHTGKELSITVDDQSLHTLDALKKFSFANPTNRIYAFLGGLKLGIDNFLYHRDFDIGLKPNGSMSLIIYSKDTDAANTPIKEETLIEDNRGSWFETEKNSVKLLTVNVNSHKPSHAFAERNFYTEFNDKLVLGKVLGAGYVREDFLFNQAAMDAIKSAIIPKTSP